MGPQKIVAGLEALETPAKMPELSGADSWKKEEFIREGSGDVDGELTRLRVVERATKLGAPRAKSDMVAGTRAFLIVASAYLEQKCW